MKYLTNIRFLLLMIISGIITGCIHDFPHGEGNDPTRVNLGIQLSFNLTWQDFIHQTNLATRARTERTHRFLIEIKNNDNIIGRDTLFLSDEEFEQGLYLYSLPFPLKARTYQLAVWYDKTDLSQKESPFNVGNLHEVSINSNSVVESELFRCGYASEILDLTDFNSGKGSSAVKEISLKHPGARFQIETQDFQEFVESQRASLLQGDTFTVRLNFAGNLPGPMNLYSETTERTEELPERSGPLNLPFTSSKEMVIAEGFIFCNENDFISLSISVYNSAQMIVAKTEYFSFPVKRGYITRLQGNFLMQSVNNAITIDHIWEGEIEIEI